MTALVKLIIGLSLSLSAALTAFQKPNKGFTFLSPAKVTVVDSTSIKAFLILYSTTNATSIIQNYLTGLHP